MSLSDLIESRLKEEGIVINPRKALSRKEVELIKDHYSLLLANFLPDTYFFSSLKSKVLGLGYFGKKGVIRSGFKCSHPENIFVLDNSFFNYDCTVLANGLVLIGTNVAMGPKVQIYSINHTFESGKFDSVTKPVYIEDNVWVGGGSIILPGVKISKRCVIGAGAVVTKDTEEGYLYLGSPARKIKKIN
jgi:maltose O-acetyltransferase